MRNIMLASIICASLLAVFQTHADEKALSLTINHSRVQILNANQPVLTYKYRGVPFKPYIETWHTPNGRNILRDAPSDHLHHHGLMFAVSVNDVSYWEESETGGHQVHQGFGAAGVNSGHAYFQQSLQWMSPQKKENTISESRAITLHEMDKSYLIHWSSSLRDAYDREMIIGGSHYYGLGMRFIEEMDQTGTFINSSGKPGAIFRGEERLVDADWQAFLVDLPSGPVTVAMYHHPKNIAQTTWFTMPAPFSYLSATMRYHERTFPLSAKPTVFHYGVQVWDAKLSADELNQAYQQWLAIAK